MRKIVAIAASDGSDVDEAATWKAGKRVRNLIRRSVEGERDYLAKRILRRRGVFCEPSRPDEFLAYHHRPHNVDGVVETLLLEFVSREQPDLILYPADSADWLQSAALAVAFDDRLIAAPVDEFLNRHDLDVADPKQRSIRQRLDQVANRTDAQTLIVLPLVKSGRAFADAVEQVRSGYAGRVSGFAVMVDRKFARGSTRQIGMEVGDETVNLTYLVKVDQQPLDPTDWRRIAGAGLVENPHDEWVAPSRVGLWSLYAKVGCATEPFVPSTSNRLPVSWFPRLDKMGELDALWLAECMLRRACQELSCTSRRIAFVIPREPTGSAPLGAALVSSLGVTVVRVGRDELENGSATDVTLNRLSNLAGKKIVVADESTVTYGTLSQMDSLLIRTLNRDADLRLVALELPTSSFAERPSKFASLHHWYPFLTVSGNEVSV